MGFLGVYRAVFDYAPRSSEELAITEGDVLYVLEKSAEDDWWKAKKKANAEDEEEPTGLVPNNYVEEAQPVASARALFEYTRQTDEELSFPEDASLQVFDTSDPDWILVGLDGDYGFVPANYIEIDAEASGPTRAASMPPAAQPQRSPSPAAPSLPSRPPVPAQAEPEYDEPQSPPLPARPISVTSDPSSPQHPPGPAAALAGVIQSRSSSHTASRPPPVAVSARPDSDDEPSPALPSRPRPRSTFSNDTPSSAPSPSPLSPASPQEYHRDRSNAGASSQDPSYQSGRIAPGGFHMYNISEMVSIMGKKKKMPSTLGINLKTGIILIAYEHASDGPTQEWPADRMTHYSREGKHVFLELVRPSKSVDFHAGAKDTAEEIVSALGELSGAIRANGLREVIAAGTGKHSQKKGEILYDFQAQGDDEVTVAAGDEVLIVDDTKSDEWWQVRRLKTGKEGVVPSSYIEITDIITSPSAGNAGLGAGMSSTAQNRLDEDRLFKEALKKEKETNSAEVGPRIRLPERQSSLSATGDSNHHSQQRSQRENGRSSSKPKPDSSRVRTWTDRSKSFSVEAQFLGLKDGKINLHKTNGVKIAVPIAKMSPEDIEWVERRTKTSLDEDRPLSDMKRSKSGRPSPSSGNLGASVTPAASKPEYDWFQFFLSCDVAVGLCERYSQAFNKDSMDESVLPDVDATILRNLGLREGDIIKVMRYLDRRYGRDGKKAEDGENAGGLFSGPGGTLRNNTRKGRPAPSVQTNDTIDAKALSQQPTAGGEKSPSPSPSPAAAARVAGRGGSGFDDDAWDVKPARQAEPAAQPVSSAPAPAPVPVAPVQPAPTGSMRELSLLDTPLEPAKVQTPPPATSQPQSQIQAQPTAAAPAAQLGATPGFFAGIAQQQTGIQPAVTGATAPAQPLNLGLGNRQRPVPPQMTGAQGGLMPPPPPSRPLSAPQSAQPSSFGPPPLQPQMTGMAPPPGSLNDLAQQRLQQQYTSNLQPQQTGQIPMQYTAQQQQPTGFGPGSQFMQPQMTSAPQMQQQSFQPMQNQPTGFNPNFNPGQQFPQQTGPNAYLPPAMEPQRTGMPPMQPQQTGFGQGFNPGLNGSMSQPPPSPAPLQPQQTGPAPPIRFGVQEKLAPQPTGRRANLSQATPANPFGF